MIAGTGRGLAEVLADAGYDERHVSELVRVDDLNLAQGLAALRLRPAAREPLALLVRLFLGAEQLDPDDAAAALAPLPLERLADDGLLERTRHGVRALVRLDPVDGLLVASDPQLPMQRPARDYVLMAGPSSRTLASVTVRVRSSFALDLCCGSGFQALLAARHCGRVVATDVNPRALRLAALSAELSGIENVEWLLGDLFQPVPDERFPLIVCNPPFVISPSDDLAYRDGGRLGDELSREVVEGIAERLADDGFGHVICSWVQQEGEHWSETPRRWLEHTGCDAVILGLESESPATHAIRWTSSTATSPDEAAVEAGEWVDYYRSLGIERIASGVVIVRRRNGDNWLAAEELGASGPRGGEHVLRVFAGNDAVAGIDDSSLLTMSLAIPGDVRIVERWSGGSLEQARLTAEGGLQMPGRIAPPGAAAILHALDGNRSVAAAADDSGVTAAELDTALPSIRDLLRRGYLEIAPGPR